MEKTKTNLLVFLTPHIVKGAEQLSRLTDAKKTDFAKANDRYAQGELLIKFRDGTPENRISGILSAEGASVMSELKPKELYLVRLKKGQDVREAAKIFNGYQEVEYAEPNYILKMQ